MCCGTDDVIVDLQVNARAASLMGKAAQWARVRHDHVLTLLAVAVDDTGSPVFFVYEPVYMALRDYIASLGRVLSTKEVKRMSYDALLAIQYATSQRLSFGDFTMDNMFVCQYADGFISFNLGNLGLHGGGGVAYAPLYVPPELQSDPPTATGADRSAIDMYRFGVLALELLITHGTTAEWRAEFLAKQPEAEWRRLSEVGRMASMMDEYMKEVGKSDISDAVRPCVEANARDRPSIDSALERLRGVAVYLRTIALKMGSACRNYGVAVSPDESHIVVSHDNDTLSVYAYPAGTHVRTIGSEGVGEGQFMGPGKLCFSSGGGVLVAECINRRVQDVSLTGEHMRFIGVGVIDSAEHTDGIMALAANKEFIAVGKWDGVSDGRIMLFEAVSGEFVRAFGQYGDAPGHVRCCNGMRFTPDGGKIAVVEGEYPQYRVSVFGVKGSWQPESSFVTKKLTKHEVDLTAVSDIEYRSVNEFHVCIPGDHSVRRLRDGHRRSWGGEYSGSMGRFKAPCALARHGDHLFILDSTTARVQVFE